MLLFFSNYEINIMTNFTIAAAQVASVNGKIDTNILFHLKTIEAAIRENVDYLIFPELSLTGYDLEIANQLALPMNDSRLDVFKDAARSGNVTIAVGAPIENAQNPLLSEIIFFPDGRITSYSKINVHQSEQSFFNSGSEYSILKIKHHKIANAICADLTVQEHIHQCVHKGASIYAVGALIFDKGYDRESQILQDYSRLYDVPVITANYPNSPDQPTSAGQSAFWHKGKKMISANQTETSLVVAAEKSGDWRAKLLNL